MKIGEDKNIYIVDCKRTAIASPNRGLKKFTAAQLAAFVIDDIFRKNQLDKTAISEVILKSCFTRTTG